MPTTVYIFVFVSTISSSDEVSSVKYGLLWVSLLPSVSCLVPMSNVIVSPTFIFILPFSIRCLGINISSLFSGILPSSSFKALFSNADLSNSITYAYGLSGL